MSPRWAIDEQFPHSTLAPQKLVVTACEITLTRWDARAANVFPSFGAGIRTFEELGAGETRRGEGD